MTKEQKAKMDVLVNFLTENRIPYFTTYKGNVKVNPDLYIAEHKIMVKISEGKEKDDMFFHKVKYRYHPLFIRETETKEFVLEKMQNLIIDIMKKKQMLHEKAAKKNDC